MTATRIMDHRSSGHRRAERGPTIRYVVLDSPVGRLLVAATERGVCRVRLGDADGALEASLRAEFPEAELAADADGIGAWAREIVRHLEGERRRVDVPLDLHATAFQRRVWNTLRAIPSGQTRSYAKIAEAVGAPGAARAVARACATNPVALIVPCHRVVRGDGGLGGYRWGVARKGVLLERRRAEQAEAQVLRTILPAATDAAGAIRPSETAQEPVRVVAGRYELRRRLGTGAMGVVYQAHDRVLEEAVALKLVRTDSAATDAQQLARVVEEVRLTRRVTHPNVVRTHDVGADGCDRFLVMEYVEGTSLDRVLAQRRLPPAAAVVLGMQLCRALEAVHARGVLHRDVKPQNILITTQGLLKLSDFGVAALRDAVGAAGSGSASPGTPAYMAPELLFGEPAGVPADLFAAGVVLHESVTGRPPFEGRTPTALAAAMLRDDPLPIATDGSVPSALGKVISAALAADPAQRPTSAAAFHDELAALEA